MLLKEFAVSTLPLLPISRSDSLPFGSRFPATMLLVNFACAKRTTIPPVALAVFLLKVQLRNVPPDRNSAAPPKVAKLL